MAEKQHLLHTGAQGGRRCPVAALLWTQLEMYTSKTAMNLASCAFQTCIAVIIIQYAGKLLGQEFAKAQLKNQD